MNSDQRNTADRLFGNSQSLPNMGNLSMTSQHKKVNLRKEKDVHKLRISEFDVILPSENDTNEMKVTYFGPKDSPYEGVSF